MEGVVEAIAALPDPAPCADSDHLQLGLRPPQTPETEQRVAHIRTQLGTGHALAYLGDFDQAIQIAETQVQVAQDLNYPPIVAEAMFLAGSARLIRHAKGDGEHGRKILYDAAGVAEASRHDELAAKTWNELAFRRTWELSVEELKRYNARAQAAVDRLGDQGQHRAQLLRNAGVLLRREQDYPEAEAQLRRAIALAQRSGMAPVRIARFKTNLANVLADLGKNEAAQHAYDEARSILVVQLGPTHPEVARALFNQGLHASQTGAVEEARQLLTEAAQSWSTRGRPRSIGMARVQLVLSDVAQKSGELERAADLAKQALEIYHDRYGAGHPNLIEPLSVLSVVSFRRRDYATSIRFTEEALNLAGDAPEKSDNPAIAFLLMNLGDGLVELGREEEALSRFAESLDVLDRAGGESTVPRALIHKGRGLALLGLGRAHDAIPELEAALVVLGPHSGTRLERAATAWGLARALRIVGGKPLVRSRKLAIEALQTYRRLGETAKVERTAIERWLDAQVTKQTQN